ncbi:MAG: hypothetical protein M0C28_27250 [Candidatus Moduliflexus flocculans]|nr:hypothetical protein [Candidatus Moduliflexus flocculans]
MRNAGSYRPVRTQKVDFLTFDDFDYSRTRVVDDGWGYQADRVVVYVKDPECYVVFDIFKAAARGLLHPRRVSGTPGRSSPGASTGTTRATTASRTPSCPRTSACSSSSRSTEPRMEGVEPEKRHYQDEWLVHQSWAQHFELGETCAFVTVLVPHGARRAGHGLARPGRRRSPPSRRAARSASRSRPGDRDIVVGVKNDLRQDMSRDYRRPRYTYEAGRIKLGGFETDGDFAFGGRARRRRSTIPSST